MKRLLFLGSIVVMLNLSAALEPMPAAAKSTAAPKEVSIDTSGYVREYGTILGQIDGSGFVRDAYGSIVGKIDSAGYIRNASDAIIGQVDTSGYIRDGEGGIIGRFDSSGYLRDADGNTITRNPIDRNLALFLIFFQ